jgi:3-oxoacyl-[acyl-carrier protein] reductase
VSGAGRNIGRATAVALAREGANLLLCTSKSIELLEETANLASKHGVRVVTGLCDVSNEEQVGAFVKMGMSEFGRIDILINNATWRTMKHILETPPEEAERYVAINVTGPFLMCKAVVPRMIDRRWGRIINYTGIGAFRSARYAIVAMGRMAEVGFTRALAREVGPHGITVNAVGPGNIQAVHDPHEPPRPVVASPIPRPGTQDEHCALLTFLCSDGAAYITGQTILINGGKYFL